MKTSDWIFLLAFLLFVISIIASILWAIICSIKKIRNFAKMIKDKYKDKKKDTNTLVALKQIIVELFTDKNDNSSETDTIQQIGEQQQNTTDNVMSEIDHDDTQNVEVVQEQQQDIQTIENGIIMTKQPEVEEKQTVLKEKASSVSEENNNICEEFSPLYHK